eukprot:snap_masked-scaffold_13-processed-gene-11.17-mRNA-1 protein AED:1.00 eAED:1.00 QI:0/0/0/0/1/1/3/0/87
MISIYQVLNVNFVLKSSKSVLLAFVDARLEVMLKGRLRYPSLKKTSRFLYQTKSVHRYFHGVGELCSARGLSSNQIGLFGLHSCIQD